MAADQVEIEISASPEDVWAKVGDFGAIGELFPDINSVRLEGDDRIIDMAGLEVRERLLRRDDQERSITYSVIGGVPVDHHEATVSVRAAGEGSLVTWAFDITPDEMTPIFADTYGKALGVLQATFA